MGNGSRPTPKRDDDGVRRVYHIIELKKTRLKQDVIDRFKCSSAHAFQLRCSEAQAISLKLCSYLAILPIAEG